MWGRKCGWAAGVCVWEGGQSWCRRSSNGTYIMVRSSWCRQEGSSFYSVGKIAFCGGCVAQEVLKEVVSPPQNAVS